MGADNSDIGFREQASASCSARSQNLADAIAGGLLKSSPALATRLAAAESELAKIQTTRSEKAPVLSMLPRVAERYLAAVDQLDSVLTRDPDRARSAIVDVLGPSIVLQPDSSGKHLWAEYGLEAAPLLLAAGASEIMVAGAGFEPATFGL